MITISLQKLVEVKNILGITLNINLKEQQIAGNLQKLLINQHKLNKKFYYKKIV